MSKLRNPISKSTTHVVCPRWANPVAKDAADVVLPTPPLPEVMHMMRPRLGVSLSSSGEWSTSEGWESTNGWDVGADANALKDVKLCCCCCCCKDAVGDVNFVG